MEGDLLDGGPSDGQDGQRVVWIWVKEGEEEYGGGGRGDVSLLGPPTRQPYRLFQAGEATRAGVCPRREKATRSMKPLHADPEEETLAVVHGPHRSGG